MNYLQAKTELLNNTPPMPLHLIAIQSAILVATAGLLVKLFA